MKNQRFVVFLYVDGVLNSRTTVQKTPDGYQGIDDARVELLSNVMHMMGAGDIVFSSDWKDLKPTADDYVYLVSKLEKYGLMISEKTEGRYYDRGAGIAKYLKNHPEIEEYVILDDNEFDFRQYPKIWERLLLTNGIERAQFAAKTPATETILFMEYIKEF